MKTAAVKTGPESRFRDSTGREKGRAGRGTAIDEEGRVVTVAIDKEEEEESTKERTRGGNILSVTQRQRQSLLDDVGTRRLRTSPRVLPPHSVSFFLPTFLLSTPEIPTRVGRGFHWIPPRARVTNVPRGAKSYNDCLSAIRFQRVAPGACAIFESCTGCLRKWIATYHARGVGQNLESGIDLF